MSHISAIGFPFSSTAEFNALVRDFFDDARTVPAEGGHYEAYTDPSGAEMHLLMHGENGLTGFAPHFAGEGRMKVALIEGIPDEKEPLIGSYKAWANPTDPENQESGTYPLFFDVPDFAADAPFLPYVTDIQLCAFADRLQAFPDEEAYYAHQTSEPKFGSQYFIPAGLFTERKGLKPRPTAVFAGKVIEAEIRTNTVTGKEFGWMLVETYDATVDVVYDTVLFPVVPTIGGVIEGDFWLSAKILP